MSTTVPLPKPPVAHVVPPSSVATMSASPNCVVPPTQPTSASANPMVVGSRSSTSTIGSSSWRASKLAGSIGPPKTSSTA
jgi:hypothetical protein